MSNDFDSIIFIIVAVTLVGSILLVVWLMFRERWVKHGTVMESPLVKRRAVIDHAGYGSLEVTGWKPYSEEHGLLLCVSEDGTHYDFQCSEDEIVPKSNIKNAVGERGYYEYVPDHSRTAAIRKQQAENAIHVARTTEAKQRTVWAEANARIQQANKKSEVNDVIDQHAKLQKAQQPRQVQR